MMRSLLRRFRRSEKGSLSVEAVLIFPILLWAYAALFIYWDAFKTQNLNLKAAYTVADLLSRQSQPITPSFVDGMNTIYAFLIRKNTSNDIRVSVVRFVEDPADPDGPPLMGLAWSEATGTYSGHSTIEPLKDKLPMMPEGDELIVVETRMTWEPPINFSLEYVGLSTRDFTNLVFTSRRSVGVTCWDADGDRSCDSMAVHTM